MTRVDELQLRYPTVPRDMVIAWDVLRCGIRDSAVIDKVSHYDRGGLYQSRDTDVTLQEIAKKRPESVKQGFVLRTPRMVMQSGFAARVIRDSKSPYQIREESSGNYALYEGEDKVQDVYFPCPVPWANERDKEPRTSKGAPVSSLVRQYNPRCFTISPVRHCEYFNTGDQCKFCNFNFTQEDSTKTSGSRLVTINPEETVEAFKIISSVGPKLVEGRLIMGAMADADKESGTHLNFVEKLATANSYTPHLALSTQPMSRKMLQRLKDAGISAINMNIEVWDADLFEEVCPGKAKYRGRERYLEAYQYAVDILGWGYVGTNMPPGVTVMPENGHKTWQESRDSQIEGFHWLIEHGVFPIFESLVLGRGSVYGDNPGNGAKLPPTDLYLDLALAHHEACLEYGMYERMDKLLWCPIDCTPINYSGQLGMVALAGDIGKWADRVFPDGNWLSRFVDTFRSPAMT